MTNKGKLALVLSLLLCGSAAVTSAQPAGRPTSKPAGRMNDAMMEKKDAAMKDAKDAKDKAMKDMKDMKGNMDAPGMQSRMMLKAKMHKNDPSALLAMQTELGLTPDQISQLEALAAETRTKAAAVLTPEQKAKIASLADEAMSPQEMHRKMMQKMKAQGMTDDEIKNHMMSDMNDMEMQGKEKWNSEANKMKSGMKDKNMMDNDRDEKDEKSEKKDK